MDSELRWHLRYHWTLEQLQNGLWLPDWYPPPMPWEPLLADLDPADGVDYEHPICIRLYNAATLTHSSEVSGPLEGELEGQNPQSGWISIKFLLGLNWLQFPIIFDQPTTVPICIAEWLNRLSLLQPREHFRYAFRLERYFCIQPQELDRRLASLRTNRQSRGRAR